VAELEAKESTARLQHSPSGYTRDDDGNITIANDRGKKIKKAKGVNRNTLTNDFRLIIIAQHVAKTVLTTAVKLIVQEGALSHVEEDELAPNNHQQHL